MEIIWARLKVGTIWAPQSGKVRLAMRWEAHWEGGLLLFFVLHSPSPIISIIHYFTSTLVCYGTLFVWRLRGAAQKFPLTNLGFWCLFCVLGYSKHFIFSWKFSFFWLGLVGIEVYWGPITSWIDEISLSHLCIVCFITFLTIYKGKFCLSPRIFFGPPKCHLQIHTNTIQILYK